jgi:hypothetical protein
MSANMQLVGVCMRAGIIIGTLNEIFPPFFSTEYMVDIASQFYRVEN